MNHNYENFSMKIPKNTTKKQTKNYMGTQPKKMKKIINVLIFFICFSTWKKNFVSITIILLFSFFIFRFSVSSLFVKNFLFFNFQFLFYFSLFFLFFSHCYSCFFFKSVFFYYSVIFIVLFSISGFFFYL